MSGLLEIDERQFSQAFAQRSIGVQHALSDHHLFTMEAIGELADKLPPDSVRRERGDLPVVNPEGYVDAGEGPPSETIRGIEHNGFRVSLRDIQQVPEYADLINEGLDEVSTTLGDREGGMQRRAGYLFISSPAATTPMHFDPEHSFLLQVRGAKVVSSCPFADPAVRQSELDRYYDGQPCHFDEMASEAATFRITPGEGVYLPSFVPHWVETEAGISVSFSIPFYTAYCERAEYVNRVNKRLRQLRLSPRPPGGSETVDRAKATLFKSWGKLRKVRQKVSA